jgi:hypothetical protein
MLGLWMKLRLLDRRTYRDGGRNRQRHISPSRLWGTGRASCGKRFVGFLFMIPGDPLARMLRLMFGLGGTCEKYSPIFGDLSLANMDVTCVWPGGHGGLYAEEPQLVARSLAIT